MTDPHTVACAGAVVFDDAGRLLMVRRGHLPSRGLWSEPSGRCEPGETPEQTAVRECAEETGLIVRVRDRLGCVSVDGAQATRYRIDVFRCELVDGSLRAGDDAAEARWVDAAEFATLELAPQVGAALRSWGCLPR